MIKRFVLAAILLILVFGGVIGFKLYKQAATREYLSNLPIPAVHVNGTVARGGFGSMEASRRKRRRSPSVPSTRKLRSARLFL